VNLEVVWVEFSTLSQAVLMMKPKLRSLRMATSKVKNLAQVLPCWLKFVHGLDKNRDTGNTEIIN
jgi:hypothetical protein